MRSYINLMRLSIFAGIACGLLCAASAQVPEVEYSVNHRTVEEAGAWLSIGGYHAARQELEHLYSFVSTAERKRDVLFILLKCAYEDQEYESAYQWSGDFLDEFPNDGGRNDVIFIHGVSAFQTGRTAEAVKGFDRFLAETGGHPMRGAAFFWRAMCRLEDGDWESAEADVSQCYGDSATGSYHDFALAGWALSLERRAEYAEAARLLEKLIDRYPESELNGPAKIRLASILLRLGKPSESAKVLEDVKPTRLQRQEYSLIRAEAYLQSGDYESSQHEFRNFTQSYRESRYARKASYGLAWSYLKQGNYGEARREFDSLGIGNDSLSFNALYQSAVLALLQKKPKEALARFELLTERSPYDDLAENSYYQTGLARYRERQFIEARRAFQLAARLFPEGRNRPRAYRMLGETNIALGDFSNAQYAFARVRQLGGSPDLVAPSMFQEGVCLYHLGRFRSSSGIFGDFLKKFPDDSRSAEAYIWKGEALYQDGNYPEAERSYANGMRLFPDSPKRAYAAYGYAWTLFEQKKFAQAAAAFDRFKTEYPNDEHIYEATLRQADCHYFMGDYEKSASLYGSLTDLKKNSHYSEYAAFQVAMSYIQRGESERGIRNLRDFIARFPASLYNEVAQFNIGWTYFSKNRFGEAVSELRKLQYQYPESQLMPRVLFSMGDAFYNMHQYDSARAYYRQVPKDFPSSPLVADALQGLQYTYEAEGKPAAAIEQIEKLLAESPAGISQEELLLRKADILFGQGDFAGAVSEYQKLLALKPNRTVQAKVYHQLARSYEMENNTPQAVLYYKRILNDFSDAEFAPAVSLALGLAYLKTKRPEDAAGVFQDFEKNFLNSPLLPEVRYNLGVALLSRKVKRPAVEQFRIVIKNHPEDIFADRSRLQIARFHTGNKEFKASLDTLDNLIGRRNDDLAAEGLLMVGENYLTMKKTAEALRAFKDVYEQYVEYPLLVERAHLGAGECYERLKNSRLARTEYEAVVNSAVDPAVRKDAQDRLRRLR